MRQYSFKKPFYFITLILTMHALSYRDLQALKSIDKPFLDQRLIVGWQVYVEGVHHLQSWLVIHYQSANKKINIFLSYILYLTSTHLFDLK